MEENVFSQIKGDNNVGVSSGSLLGGLNEGVVHEKKEVSILGSLSYGHVTVIVFAATFQEASFLENFGRAAKAPSLVFEAKGQNSKQANQPFRATSNSKTTFRKVLPACRGIRADCQKIGNSVFINATVDIN